MSNPSSLMSRRRFLELACLTAVGGGLSGCAVNPVTGQSQLMLMSRSQEIQVDKERSPHQFSADYGTLQDRDLNAYIQSTGRHLSSRTHRPDMPYDFQGVNATYVNAYAFPGGSIAVTRGILLELDNEAQLAALLGHELGHVNARHTASRMTKGVLVSAVMSGASLALGDQEEYGGLISGLGGIGAGALLAKYSRDNERQADDLGLEYMTRAGYNPQGMVGLMDMLQEKNTHTPSAFEQLFSSHPMSADRYRRMREQAFNTYKNDLSGPFYAERYMDKTAGLRRIKPAIESMQEGQKLMGQKAYAQAEQKFKKALKIAPNDYAGLVMLSKSLLAQQRYAEAEKIAQVASGVYPQEAQALHFMGVARVVRDNYSGAYQAFHAYEQKLPGNPLTTFLAGLSLEGMGRRQQAASHYVQYLRMTNQGKQAQYAYSRLQQWGVVQ